MSSLPTKVIVHPLVLLSTVDHFNRVASATSKRVVGVLLGEIQRRKTGEVVVDVTNSYAVPFEEEESKSSIWFLDHNYHENMEAMFRKVNAKEKVVGWYSSGPRIRPADLEINELFRNYTPNPVLVIIDVRPQDSLEIPTNAYISIEEVKEDGTEPPTRRFIHITSEIGALEAEEVGVEHLLRDVKDTNISTLGEQIQAKITSLKSLIGHLQNMQKYLTNVANGRLPLNQQIISNFQDILNLLPNLNVDQLARSFAVKTNDMMLVIYLSSLIRSVIALHNLINNQIENRDAERKMEEGKDEKDQKKGKSEEGKDEKDQKKGKQEEGKDEKDQKQRSSPSTKTP
jgi:26S proteasome regulatory subunit N8